MWVCCPTRFELLPPVSFHPSICSHLAERDVFVCEQAGAVGPPIGPKTHRTAWVCDRIQQASLVRSKRGLSGKSDGRYPWCSAGTPGDQGAQRRWFWRKASRHTSPNQVGSTHLAQGQQARTLITLTQKSVQLPFYVSCNPCRAHSAKNNSRDSNSSHTFSDWRPVINNRK